MKHLAVIFFCLTLLCSLVYPEIGGLLEKIDALNEEYKHAEVISLIENSMGQAADNKEKAELTWRLSRATLYSGDIAEDNGKPKAEVLTWMEKAETLADQAIRLDPGNPYTYHWKSSAMGRWGQVKGILDSLIKAKPMKVQLEIAINQDNNFCKSFQVLGMLYEALPGWPVSFGDPDAAVSLGRKALDLHLQQVKSGKEAKIDYSYYKELAQQLYKRGWNEKKREKEQAKKNEKYTFTTDILEKNFYYEGTLKLTTQSDREEAGKILNMVIDTLSKKAGKTKYEEKDLQKAREFLAEWEK